ncbi:MAG: hypothetical protein K8J31_10730 [Anaerolineae bacterium]|nr:hypothetical protein [Anaerolineae bacterium]
MTLQELLKAVDELPWDDLEKIQVRIDQRRSAGPHRPMSAADVQRQIAEILKDAEPVELIPGTMDVEKLEAVMESIRNSFTVEELDEIVKAMNAEYIEPEDQADG